MRLQLVLLLSALTISGACGDDDDDSGATEDAGVDGDGDADADADADTDADADADADADTDGDGDVDAGPEPDAAVPGDEDGDGYAGLATGGDDCDDARSEIHPGAIEATDWEVEVLDSAEGMAGTVSIVVEAGGVAHLAYSIASLEYATNATGEWTIEDVDEDGRHYPSIALSPEGTVNIAYTSVANDLVRRAELYDGDWEVDDVAESASWGNGMIFEPGGVPWIAYSSGVLNEDVRVASDSGGAWDSEGIGDDGYVNDIAVDPSGNLHVLLMDGYAVLRVATNADEAWSSAIVSDSEAGITGEGFASFAIDGAGTTHVAFDRAGIEGVEGIRYAANDTGEYEEEMIFDGLGTVPSLALDGEGNVYIAFYDYTGGRLMLATNASGQWVTDPVADFPRFFDLSFEIGPEGLMHLAYESPEELFYARKSLPNGRDDDCDGEVW